MLGTLEVQVALGLMAGAFGNGLMQHKTCRPTDEAVLLQSRKGGPPKGL